MKRAVERVTKWAMPILIVAEIVMVRSGMLNLQAAVGMVVGIESLLALVAGAQVFRMLRRYRRDRAAKLDAWSALEASFAELLPRRAARIVTLEFQLWACLVLWVFRRRRADPSMFTYHKRSIFGVFLLAALFSSPVEILLFEFLIPWAWLKVVLLLASVYSVFWLVGLYASQVTLPHRLEAEGVRLHAGALASGFIPYAALAEVAREQRKTPKKSQGLSLSADQSAAYFGIDGTSDAALHLSVPQQMRGFVKWTPPVSTVYLAVDEPERFVRELRQRLAQRGEQAASPPVAEAAGA